MDLSDVAFRRVNLGTSPGPLHAKIVARDRAARGPDVNNGAHIGPQSARGSRVEA